MRRGRERGEPVCATCPSRARGRRRGARKLDPVEIAEEHLAAIDEAAELNAVITTSPETALERARAGPTGPLAGAPLLVKDIFDTAGIRTTYGSALFREHVPPRYRGRGRSCRAGGCDRARQGQPPRVRLGTTSQNPHYGFVVNPVRPDRIAGGSSGGNAAALAARLCVIGIGTDTGGSARGPSSCCSTVGFKPSLGTISTDGCFPLSPSLDTVAPMARTVADCELLYSVLAGTPRADARMRGLVVGLLARPPRVSPADPLPDVPADTQARLVQHAARLEELGAHVIEVELRTARRRRRARTGERRPSRTAVCTPNDATSTERTRARSSTRREPSRRRLRARRATRSRLWRRRTAADPAVDLILCPTLGGDVPAITAREQDVRGALLAYTRPFNFLDWAAIAVADFQLAGRDATTVFGAALAWEEAYGPPEATNAWARRVRGATA